MTDERIEPGQVWRYRDEREDRNVVLDSCDGHFVHVHNQATGRRSRMRVSVLERYYRQVSDV